MIHFRSIINTNHIKIWLLLPAILIFNISSGQYFYDDFESYNTGDQLACVSAEDWTTWNNLPCSDEDPFIATSGSQVLEIIGYSDLVFPMPNWTALFVIISFDIYIPSGADGYFNTLQLFDGSNSQWGMQVYFGHTNPGEGNIDGGGALAASFTFEYDTWNNVDVVVDLLEDWAWFKFNDDQIHEWQWSTGTFGTGTLNQLGGNNFYAWDGGVYGNPHYYLDNYKIMTDMGGFFDPPSNVSAEVINENDVLVSWEPPAQGQLVQLMQHDGNAENGYYQDFGNGYGVVYDISGYPGSSLEFIDFRHSSWGIFGTWDYKLHIVDWDTYTEIAVTDVLQTTGNDQWEENISLSSIQGQSGLVGIFLEPLSNEPTNAYPCLDGDNNLDGMSFYGSLADYTNMDLSIDVGDFLMDLWIMIGEDKMTVKAPKFMVNNTSKGIARMASNPVTVYELTLNQTDNINSIKSILQGYNIWRNDVNIDYVNSTITSYVDEDVNPGTYLYCVSAVYDDGESQEVCADFIIIETMCCPPPINLTGPEVVWPFDDIILNWQPPGSSIWIQWDYGINSGNGIGLSNGGIFSCASHWSPDDLTQYNGMSLSKIQFYANGDPDAMYVIKVWIGSEGNIEVHSQVVTSFNVDNWNEIILINAIPINATEDFWFGYEVTHGPGTFPAGCDDGPAFQYNGDMINIGTGWVSMSTEFALDYNWNLAGWIELSENATIKMGSPVSFVQNHGLLKSCGSSGFFNKKDINQTKDLLGYNIYRDGSEYDFVAAPTTTYVDFPYNSAEIEYCVTSVYNEGESLCSNIISVLVIVDDIQEKAKIKTRVFPNPASNILTIESDIIIKSIIIYDSFGQEILQQEAGNNSFKVNTNNYPPGIYFIQLETEKGQISQKVIFE